MKSLIIGALLCAYTLTAQAQNQFKAKIINCDTKEIMPGATVLWKQGNQQTVADAQGMITISDIPDGVHLFIFSFIGFEEKKFQVTFPLTTDTTFLIDLDTDHHGHEEEEVIVMATRNSRTIANLPTRIEVISGEELEEKSNMKPGDIRMLLNETTGIQTQQTSATSFNAGIRIQGLDGRYTQILKDGFPLYSGFSGGLSLLQIAPLDLKQVEVIKGSSSTLYGGGAIAGLVNLVSKTPQEEKELNFLANATSAGGLDLSGFYSERYGKIGLTLFGSRNSNRPFDPADIGLTAIPEFERYTINPRIFFYHNKTNADIGVSYITENRTGGNVDYIKNGGNGYFEKNNTDRVVAQINLKHDLSENSFLRLKSSYNHFNRSIEIPQYIFDALQQSTFSEFSWNKNTESMDWVIGVNYITDQLKQKQAGNGSLRDYDYRTAGVFIQNTWTVNEHFSLETGLRGDHVNEFGFELLPRVSAMWKINESFTTRLGSGFGYKSPSIFTEEAERRQFRAILPINLNNTRNERSVGANWDINYRTRIGEVGVNFNHLFFYTRLNRPMVLENAGNNNVSFVNSTGYIDTKGMETNLKLSYHDFKLFIGYTYTDANTHFNNKEWLPLTARHRLNNVLMYEVEEKWKIGLEAYYYSRQQLNDGTFGQSYWITGLMAEKIWEKISLFINFENFSNTRQTRFGNIYTGSIDNPVFKDIYAPLDGFVVNGGIKLKL
ncbi:TonB-dependent receptor [Gynurincola endophyticus]|uniref:TonB-dependent receptor n=1 Tax=Gynurincola endophyticus TaxID=2479004 RepID=UPI000F8D8DDE|nr:TonB-dependent receptor [Gynurincola endophyticus]